LKIEFFREKKYASLICEGVPIGEMNYSSPLISEPTRAIIETLVQFVDVEKEWLNPLLKLQDSRKLSTEEVMALYLNFCFSGPVHIECNKINRTVSYAFLAKRSISFPGMVKVTSEQCLIALKSDDNDSSESRLLVATKQSLKYSGVLIEPGTVYSIHNDAIVEYEKIK